MIFFFFFFGLEMLQRISCRSNLNYIEMPKEMDEFLNKLEKQTGFWDATALQLICAALSFLLIMLVKNITHNFPPSMLTLFLN